MIAITRRASRLLGLTLCFGFAGLSAPAYAAAPPSEVLGPAGAAAQGLTAYGGHVVWSQFDRAVGRWRLLQYFAGKVSPLAVGSRRVPFDADAGPDATGKPRLVYSRCAVEPSAPRGVNPAPDWNAAHRCRLYTVSLAPGGREHPVAGLHLARTESATTPTMWHGALAFALHRTRAHFAQVVLRHGARLRTLVGGRRPTCRHVAQCRPSAISGGVDQMDLGPRGLVFLWRASGGDVGGTGTEWQLRQDLLTATRSSLLDRGEISGTCGYALPTSPNALDHGAAWLQFSILDCDMPDTAELLQATTTAHGKRSTRHTTLDGFPLTLAIDGNSAYWIRDQAPGDNRPHDAQDCIDTPTQCDLMRTALNP
jgi:hypothetical protein